MAAFTALFDGQNEVGREKKMAKLLEFLADNQRLTPDEALDIFLRRDKQLEKVAGIIFWDGQVHGS